MWGAGLLKSSTRPLDCLSLRYLWAIAPLSSCGILFTHKNLKLNYVFTKNRCILLYSHKKEKRKKKGIFLLIWLIWNTQLNTPSVTNNLSLPLWSLALFSQTLESFGKINVSSNVYSLYTENIIPKMRKIIKTLFMLEI